MIYVHWIFFLLYAFIVIAAMVAVLMDNRQPAKTMAWILVLVFLPVVGFVLYFFFGQNTRKEKLISQQSMDQLTKRSMLGFAEQQNLVLPDEHSVLIKLFASQNWALPFKNNETDIYTDGYGFFHALLRDISQARHHIHLETYIICDDSLGYLVSDALIAKAKEGVEVRFIYDDVGCWNVPNSFFERMRNAGIDVHAFMPVKFPAFTSKVNYRNHRKLCVIDGRVGFIGGMNIADRYVEGPGWGVWRDTHFRIEGRGVAGLQVSFLSDWSATTKQHVSGEAYFPPTEHFTNNILQIVPGSPLGKWRTLLQAYSLAISRARHRIWIQTPYYLPPDVLNTALQVAALAGIDVRLMLPARSDSKAIDYASHSYLDDMVKAGVKILFYRPGFLHSKLLIVDDTLTVIGSANMDFRSFEHNFEVCGFVYDADFTARMAAIFTDDAAQCTPLAPGKWFKRPRSHKFAESFLRLCSPLM